jgi:hypothetical protein
MPFIGTYNGAMQLLGWIETGRCKAGCRSGWLRNFKYALKTPTNPLKLTAVQRKTMKARIASLSGRRISPVAKTLKKYKNRPSPSYPANENCGKTMKGNDGLMYKSVANKAGVCSWRQI